MADGFTLHVVCPNHALDRLLVVPRFAPFTVNRAARVETLPGGKGMIVCRAARRLGAQVAVHGFVGGPAGALVRQGCADLGAEDQNTVIAGATRTTTVLVDAHSARTTVVNEPGPRIDAADLEAFYARLTGELRPGDVVVATGSLPEGCPRDVHARVARIARDHGALALVDAADEVLSATIADLERDPAPVLLKTNSDELTAAAPQARQDLMGTMDRIARSTGGTVVVTLGERGAAWRSADRRIRVGSPAVATVNPTGSGDCFLAGLAVGLGRGQDVEECLVLASAMGAANAASLTPDVDPGLVRRLTAQVVIEEPSEPLAGP